MEKAIKKYWPFFLLPTLAVFVIFRRKIVGGIMGVAVKG